MSDVHHRHRPGSARAAGDGEQAVLRLQHAVWRRAEYADVPGVHRHAGDAAGDESRGVSARRCKTAVALNCEIPAFTKWDRKQYYYPDLPKNYQISQYDLPMSQHGYLDISDPKGQFEPKRVRIRRAHLEEDAGKSCTTRWPARPTASSI